jgi:hypothetical protein
MAKIKKTVIRIKRELHESDAKTNLTNITNLTNVTWFVAC